MHPIRKQILHNLILNTSLPYSKLKPKDIEGNLFIYHLKQLIIEGLVQKDSGWKYQLTLEGKKFTDKLSFENLRPRIQPKIVTLIVCINKEGCYLLYKRKKQPFLGLIGFPYGKIHLGESVLEAAIRELKEKTNLTANISHRGDVYLTIFQNKELLTQLLCHVFVAKDPIGQLKKDSDIGECFWENPNKFESAKLIPGFMDIYKAVFNKKEFFFEELTYQVI